MKTDILDRIDAALAENRQVKQRRMQAHVMWLLDNPTQLPINDLEWDESTTEITDRDIDQCASAAAWLWRFAFPEHPNHLCIRCLGYRVEGDQPLCGKFACAPLGGDTGSREDVELAAYPELADLPQPLHRGRVHIRPMVSAR